MFTAAELATLVNSGADEPVTIKFNTAVSGDTGLDSKGFDVSWVYVDATHVNGVALLDGDRVVFTLVESPAGTFTFTLLTRLTFAWRAGHGCGAHQPEPGGGVHGDRL